MKTLTLILALLVSTMGIAQEKNIETYSVSLENLIPFIVDQYSVVEGEEESQTRNITFLIQTSITNLSIEDGIILKQSFKLLSERLSENDLISILTYSGFNGVALNQTSPKNLKKILYTLNHLKESSNEFYEDGIELAYTFTEENFVENALNSVVIVRNPNTVNVTDPKLATQENSAHSKQKNKTVLLTAIAILPEIISVIKD